MKTTGQDVVLRVARNFAGKVPTEVDMGKSVNIPLRTAVAVSYLADEFVAKLRDRTSELRRQLQLGTAPNRANAEEELTNNLELMYMLENNCIPSLHGVVDAELRPK